MLLDGIIEESASPWSSHIVVVLKPDGSIRLCNDFRRLNAISDIDSYPLPTVDNLVERLWRIQFISTLYLKKGHWKVALALGAKAKTIFSSTSSHWQYQVPFQPGTRSPHNKAGHRGAPVLSAGCHFTLITDHAVDVLGKRHQCQNNLVVPLITGLLIPGPAPSGSPTRKH